MAGVWKIFKDWMGITRLEERDKFNKSNKPTDLKKGETWTEYSGKKGYIKITRKNGTIEYVKQKGVNPPMTGAPGLGAVLNIGEDGNFTSPIANAYESDAFWQAAGNVWDNFLGGSSNEDTDTSGKGIGFFAWINNHILQNPWIIVPLILLIVGTITFVLLA